jgi:hypothetical protein
MRFLFHINLYFLLGFCFYHIAHASNTITFPDLTDWQLRPEIQKYTADNLYEYINGAAPLYHSYLFVELIVAEYENAEQKTILVEIYRHIDSVHAFGIFSQEKPEAIKSLPIGVQAYLSLSMLNLCVDQYYIKILCDDLGAKTGTTLQLVARKLVEQVDTQPALPYNFKFFPDSSQVANSEKYHSHSFLGHEFLNNIYAVNYALDNQNFLLFIEETTSDFPGDSVLAAYQQFVGTKNTMHRKNFITFTDPYNEAVVLTTEKQYLIGITGIFTEETANFYLTKIRQRIQTLNYKNKE